MKTRLFSAIAFLTFFMFASLVNGQYDDVYYDPSKDKSTNEFNDKTEQENYNSSVYEKMK
ncbi:MAG: hypothetical protein IPG21_09565 [Saprospiraceae bacterium]|nr:hypothetical protein [Candidatus Vicinibacter affinis]